MDYYMLTWAANWPDKMDDTGFIILSEKEYKKFIENSKKASKSRNSFEIGIGSNEDIYYENFDKLFNSIFIEKITEEEYEIFKNHELISFGETRGIELILNDEEDCFDYDEDIIDDIVVERICLKDVLDGRNFR